MSTSKDLILHAYLREAPADRRSRLLKFLPEKELKRLQELPESPQSVKNVSNGQLIEQVHWSWFLPTLKSYDPPEQTLFLSCFDSTEAKALAAEIPCKKEVSEITPIGSAYLKDVLFKSLVGEHDQLIPADFLPPSKLNQLLELSFRRIIQLIDLLAMHDFAAELRQIVETKMLKKIYSCLSGSQLSYLKQISSKREVMQPSKILERWDGKAESLQRQLHRLGLNRLGLAMSLQDTSLVWYVSHILDIGRGSVLLKTCKTEKNRKAAAVAVRHVEDLLGTKGPKK